MAEIEDVIYRKFTRCAGCQTCDFTRDHYLFEGKVNLEDLTKEATNPLHNKIIHLETQLKQAQAAREGFKNVGGATRLSITSKFLEIFDAFGLVVSEDLTDLVIKVNKPTEYQGKMVQVWVNIEKTITPQCDVVIPLKEFLQGLNITKEDLE